MKQDKILVVDDDIRLRQLIVNYLKKNGYFVGEAESAADARDKLRKDTYDLIILDVMMPNETGFEFTEKLRSTNNIPIIMLTALGESSDKIKGLRFGVDDYLTKPFEPEELLLRIKSIIKRTNGKFDDKVSFGEYEFNIDSCTLYQNSKEIFLTSTESLVLKALSTNINTGVSREYLSKINNNISQRAIDVQITRLRKKVEDDPRKPQYITTVRNVGYMLKTK